MSFVPTTRFSSIGTLAYCYHAHDPHDTHIDVYHPATLLYPFAFGEAMYLAAALLALAVI